MEQDKEAIAKVLLDRQLISQNDFAQVKAYRALGVFSLHDELQFLLYLAVLLFTGGVGTLLYKNIDTIGHTAILILLFLSIIACFYFCFKKAPEFSASETNFDHPVYNYLVLLATILSCIFIGYLQFQYEIFGGDFSLATLASSLVAFAAAYYFDNRSALSIGITGLAASIGITVTPKALVENSFFDNPSLFYYGIALAAVLIFWTEYSERTHLKKHFNLVFLTFAQHLAGICCITGMFGDYWPLYAIFLAASTVYFWRKSDKLASVSLFVFTMIYGYIGFNILIFKILSTIEFPEFFTVFAYLTPFYFVGTIYFFIRMIKQFNKNHDDSAR